MDMITAVCGDVSQVCTYAKTYCILYMKFMEHQLYTNKGAKVCGGGMCVFEMISYNFYHH